MLMLAKINGVDVAKIYSWAIQDGISEVAVEQFLANVRITAGRRACWEWRPDKRFGKKGYGFYYSFRHPKFQSTLAHVISYFLANGPLKKPCVLHRCDNRPCVRPCHLFGGTKRDNTHDMIAKDRNSYGENHRNSKLTDNRVLEIRRLYDNGISQHAIAKKFEVSVSLINRVVLRKIWKHVI